MSDAAGGTADGPPTGRQPGLFSRYSRGQSGSLMPSIATTGRRKTSRREPPPPRKTSPPPHREEQAVPGQPGLARTGGLPGTSRPPESCWVDHPSRSRCCYRRSQSRQQRRGHLRHLTANCEPRGCVSTHSCSLKNVQPTCRIYERRKSSWAAERRSRYGSNGKNVSSGLRCRDAARGAARGSRRSGVCDEATARAAARPGMRSERDLRVNVLQLKDSQTEEEGHSCLAPARILVRNRRGTCS